MRPDELTGMKKDDKTGFQYCQLPCTDDAAKGLVHSEKENLHNWIPSYADILTQITLSLCTDNTHDKTPVPAAYQGDSPFISAIHNGIINGYRQRKKLGSSQNDKMKHWVKTLGSYEDIERNFLDGITQAEQYNGAEPGTWIQYCNSKQMDNIRHLFSPVIEGGFTKRKKESTYSPEQCELMRELFVYLAYQEKEELPDLVQNALGVCRDINANAIVYRTPPVVTCEANTMFSYIARTNTPVPTIPKEVKTIAYTAMVNGKKTGICFHTTEDMEMIPESKLLEILAPDLGTAQIEQLDTSHTFANSGFVKGRFSPAAIVGSAETIKEKDQMENIVHIYDKNLLTQPHVTDGFGAGSYGIYIPDAQTYFEQLQKHSETKYSQLYPDTEKHVIISDRYFLPPKSKEQTSSACGPHTAALQEKREIQPEYAEHCP